MPREGAGLPASVPKAKIHEQHERWRELHPADGLKQHWSRRIRHVPLQVLKAMESVPWPNTPSDTKRPGNTSGTARALFICGDSSRTQAGRVAWNWAVFALVETPPWAMAHSLS